MSYYDISLLDDWSMSMIMCAHVAQPSPKKERAVAENLMIAKHIGMYSTKNEEPACMSHKWGNKQRS